MFLVSLSSTLFGMSLGHMQSCQSSLFLSFTRSTVRVSICHLSTSQGALLCSFTIYTGRVSRSQVLKSSCTISNCFLSPMMLQPLTIQATSSGLRRIITFAHDHEISYLRLNVQRIRHFCVLSIKYSNQSWGLVVLLQLSRSVSTLISVSWTVSSFTIGICCFSVPLLGKSCQCMTFTYNTTCCGQISRPVINCFSLKARLTPAVTARRLTALIARYSLCIIPRSH